MTEKTTGAAKAAPPEQDELKTSDRKEVNTLKEMDQTDVMEAYRCPDCEAISLESGGPLYACSECMTRFTRGLSADGCSHRCPDCNRFSARVADDGCEDCGVGEVERISVYECPICGELVPLEDWDRHQADLGPAEAQP